MSLNYIIKINFIKFYNKEYNGKLISTLMIKNLLLVK